MKIAVFTDVFLEVPGGIPSSILAQKKSLEKLGHKVVVFCPGFKDKNGAAKGLSDAAATDGTIFVVPTHPLLRLNGAPLSKRPAKVRKAILAAYPNFAEEFDLVHVHYEASCSLAGMLMAREFRLPLVQTMHGREDMAIEINVPRMVNGIVASALNYLHSKFTPHTTTVKADRDLAPTKVRAKMWTLMVSHANFADQVITPSKHFAEKLKKYGVKKPISVVSNGIADAEVAEFDKLANTLVRKRVQDEPLKLFWNSRVSNEKRILPFLQALALLKKPYAFTVCGDGNALKAAQQFAQKNQLNVEFLGRVPHAEMLKKMLAQHLSITVSFGFDTQGLTLLEAEATGMPVFFCDSDMQEVVPAGGYVLASGPSPEEMAAALTEIIEQPEQIERMSREMIKHRKEILQSTQIEKLLKVYQTAINDN